MPYDFSVWSPSFQPTLCTINCYSIVFDIVPHDFFEKTYIPGDE